MKIYEQDVKDRAISLYKTGLILQDVVDEMNGPVWGTIHAWLKKAGVLRGRHKKDPLSICTGFSFEELRFALYKWAHYFEKRSDGKYEFWELINAVWLQGEIQHLKSIKIASKKAYRGMIDYIREQEGRKGNIQHTAMYNMRSLEYPIKIGNSADELFLRDVIPDKNSFFDKIYAKELWERVFNNGLLLSERSKTILRLTFEDDLTMREIGEKLGLNESRVSQIVGKVMPRIKRILLRAEKN